MSIARSRYTKNLVRYVYFHLLNALNKNIATGFSAKHPMTACHHGRWDYSLQATPNCLAISVITRLGARRRCNRRNSVICIRKVRVRMCLCVNIKSLSNHVSSLIKVTMPYKESDYKKCPVFHMKIIVYR